MKEKNETNEIDRKGENSRCHRPSDNYGMLSAYCYRVSECFFMLLNAIRDLENFEDDEDLRYSLDTLAIDLQECYDVFLNYLFFKEE